MGYERKQSWFIAVDYDDQTFAYLLYVPSILHVPTTPSYVHKFRNTIAYSKIFKKIEYNHRKVAKQNINSDYSIKNCNGQQATWNMVAEDKLQFIRSYSLKHFTALLFSQQSINNNASGT